MKIAVMQPYFMPYLGYFQLLNFVDSFIFFDDVNFIKKSWINRNRILINGNSHLITIPLSEASQNKKINEIELAIDDNWKIKFNNKLFHAYRKAPFFEETYDLVNTVISRLSSQMTIAEAAQLSVEKVAKYLDIQRPLLKSSDLEYNRTNNGADKIISICKQFGANTYVNPIGGQNLYDKSNFEGHKIDLKFLKIKDDLSYNQGGSSFVSNLSIIDCLMFNEIQKIKIFLHEYTLI